MLGTIYSLAGMSLGCGLLVYDSCARMLKRKINPENQLAVFSYFQDEYYGSTILT